MPLDAYSFCPGGTGKRIKFCCKDLLGDLQQIDRMIEGEQHLACLQHIERLEQNQPPRACLMAIKAQLLRALERADELRPLVERFAKECPDNPVALAEMAMLLADDGAGRAALEKLQRAIVASGQAIHARVYDAMDSVANALLSEGQLLAARALLLYQVTLVPDDREPMEALMHLNSSPDIPLLLKQDPPIDTAVGDVGWKDEFQQAMKGVGSGHWEESAQRLEALVAKVGDAPSLWRNIAALRAWLADTERSAAALHKYAALDVPLEDAVEAETLALLMSANPLGDEVDVLNVAYPVNDLERVQAALTGSPCAIPFPVDRLEPRDAESQRPTAGFFLVAPAQPDSWQGLSVDRVPAMLAQCLLFGRQTDREARLVVAAAAESRFPAVDRIIREVVGDALAGEPERTVVGRISASRELLRDEAFLPAKDVPRDEAQRLAADVLRDKMLGRWTQLPLALLDGQTPRQAAAVPGSRVKLLAAIFLMQSWSELAGGEFDFNLVRSELGLPTLGPLDPAELPVERLSLVRLARLDVAKLNDDELRRLYQHALAFQIPTALPKLARAVVDRPSLAASEECRTACRVLAQTERDPQQAVHYIDRARKAEQAAGRSCASLDFQELDLRIRSGQGEAANRLLAHLQQQHIREPGVAEALYRILVQIGAISPDGRPTAPSREEPSLIVPGGGEAEPGKIWTPDSETPGGQRGKLWTPD